MRDCSTKRLLDNYSLESHKKILSSKNYPSQFEKQCGNYDMKKIPNFFYCDSFFKTLLCLTEMGVLAQRATPLVGGALLSNYVHFYPKRKLKG